jgi:hypothetical protein
LGFLDIESDEIWDISIKHQSGAFGSVVLNYLDIVPARWIHITLKDLSIFADFNSGQVIENGICRNLKIERDGIFREMHRAVIENRTDSLWSLQDALNVLQAIEGIQAVGS